MGYKEKIVSARTDMLRTEELKGLLASLYEPRGKREDPDFRLSIVRKLREDIIDILHTAVKDWESVPLKEVKTASRMFPEVESILNRLEAGKRRRDATRDQRKS